MAADDMVCVSRRAYPVGANWKLYLENFSDGYHVPFVHQHTLNFKRCRSATSTIPASISATT